MTELNELIEYLYETSRGMRRHGLEAIAELLIRDHSMLEGCSLVVLCRGLIRTLQEDRERLDEETLFILFVATLALKRIDESSEVSSSDMREHLCDLFIWRGSLSHKCSQVDSFSCRILHVCFLHLSPLKRGTLRDSWNPKFLAHLVRVCKHAPLREACLRQITQITSVWDYVDTLESDLVGVLESDIIDHQAQIPFESWCALYNLSFHIDALRCFSWQIYWDSLHEPSAVRILIHGLQSGTYPGSAIAHSDGISRIWRMFLSERICPEATSLLKLVVTKISNEEKRDYVRGNKMFLLQVILFCIESRNTDLARVFLYFPTSWAEDKKSLILERLKTAGPLQDDMIFVIARFYKNHADVSQTFPRLLDWSNPEFVERAFKNGDPRLIERAIFSLKLTGSLDSLNIASIQAIPNEASRLFALKQFCKSVKFASPGTIFDTQHLNKNELQILRRISPENKAIREKLKRIEFNSWRLTC